MRILLACDRSRGHSHPALALARYIKTGYPQHKIIFYGLQKDDKSFLKRQGFVCFGVDLGLRNIIIESFFYFFEALVLMIALRPKRVFGFGGRNSFFIVLIASFFVPAFLFEPNSTFGAANRVLYFFVKKVFLGLKEPRKEKEVAAGIPLRDEITDIDKDRQKSSRLLNITPDLKTILVFGGSQGSSFINNVFIETASILVKRGCEFQVIHVAGKKDFLRINSLYKMEGIKARVFDFYQDMGLLYSASDIVVSRSGASTLAEICFFGKPSILVPYPHAYGHQIDNAFFLFRRKAALVFEQSFLDSRKLAQVLGDFFRGSRDFSFLEINAKNQKIWKTKKDFSEKLLSYL
ncbi:MAG: UDP-N-acetylglucosamine--N-acetylmuramyl-(pentapeptide) pyrophosphoryl-undecaprenol N-acetylglucosamine transferase [Candidatus Omnitrophica bacterium]|nr:UDP-N-acetylglucosamine--N-acetylmuramyl-(pentapeptide) pyrophosphoryl-undecaprenol N-acetylglucosamine transferase [Candidatus Omnitrophota bacterium]